MSKVSVAVGWASMINCAIYNFEHKKFLLRFEEVWYETRKFSDHYYGNRGFISNSASILYCSKLPCMCWIAWRLQPAGESNWKRACLLQLTSTKNDAVNIISDEVKGINSNCCHLKSIWSESDNGFNLINVWQIKYETKLNLTFPQFTQMREYKLVENNVA